jgi:hypothetical protein
VLDPFLLLAPLYLLGVIALLGFVGCFTKPPFVGDTSLPLIVDQTPGGFRNESGWYGMTITVGPEKLTVRALGRYFLGGNSGTHRVRIVDPAGPTDIALSMVSLVAGPTDPDDPYIYAYLTSPYPTLEPGGEYHVMSEEVVSGDRFHDQDTTVRTIAQTIPDAVIKSGVYSDAPGVFVAVGGAEHAYGPVNLRYVLELND